MNQNIVFVPLREDIRIFNEEEEIMKNLYCEIEKCYFCKQKLIELVRLVDKRTRNYTKVCGNQDCVLFVDYQKTKERWVKV